MNDIESQITQAHLDYEAFIKDPDHLGFSAEAYWMASRGLFDPWLAQMQAKYRFLADLADVRLTRDSKHES